MKKSLHDVGVQTGNQRTIHQAAQDAIAGAEELLARAIKNGDDKGDIEDLTGLLSFTKLVIPGWYEWLKTTDSARGLMGALSLALPALMSEAVMNTVDPGKEKEFAGAFCDIVTARVMDSVSKIGAAPEDFATGFIRRGADA